MKDNFNNHELRWTLKERIEIFFQDLKSLPRDIKDYGLKTTLLDVFTQRYLR
jgi:hypothetical protein